MAGRRSSWRISPNSVIHSGFGLCLTVDLLLVGSSNWITHITLLATATAWLGAFIGLARNKGVAYLVLWTLSAMLLVGFYSRPITLHLYSSEILAGAQFRSLTGANAAAALLEISLAYVLCILVISSLSRWIGSTSIKQSSNEMTTRLTQKLIFPSLLVNITYFLVSIVLPDPRSYLSTGSLLGLFIRSLPINATLAVFAVTLALPEVSNSARKYLSSFGLFLVLASETLNGKRGILVTVLRAFLLAKIVVNGRDTRIGVRFLFAVIISIALLPSLLPITLQARERSNNQDISSEITLQDVSIAISRRTGALDSYWTVQNVTPNHAEPPPTPISLIVTTVSTLIPSEIQTLFQLDPRPTSGVVFAQRYQGRFDIRGHAGAYSLPGLFEDMHRGLWLLSFSSASILFFLLMRKYKSENMIWNAVLLVMFSTIVAEGNLDGTIGAGAIGLIWILLSSKKIFRQHRDSQLAIEVS